MAGRKPALPASVLIDAVLKFKDKIISTNDKGKKEKSGITSKRRYTLYSQRAELIIKQMSPSIKMLEYRNSLVLCESTISHAINKLIIDVPSAIEIKKCSIDACDTQVVSILKYITFQVNDRENIKELQTYINTRTKTEYINCGDNCNGVKTITTDISKIHLFIDILYWEGDYNQKSSEAGIILKIKLCDIPTVLTHNSVTYELRGVICYHKGKSSLRNSIGHYNTYSRRGYTRNWELYDDLKKTSIPVKDTTMVPCEFVFYTI